MEINLLFSWVLYIIIGVLIVLCIITIIATIRDAKVSQEKFIDLREQLGFQKLLQEQIIQKNAYLESYNMTLLNKLFEITKELFLTKKIILEEYFN